VAAKTEEREIGWVIVRRIIVDVVDLTMITLDAAHTAGTIRFELDSRVELGRNPYPLLH
jgi:hypothetical protein